MKIRSGDILMRFLLPFAVWHYGIVIKVESQNANDILMYEFSDTNEITKITMYDFMYKRKYCWIDKFEYERNTYGSSVFFPIEQRLNRAHKLYKRNNLRYTLRKYNCEYFVRRCVFNDDRLWVSKQTYEMSKSEFMVIEKLVMMAILTLSTKMKDNTNEFEANLNPSAYKYSVCDDCGYIYEYERNKKVNINHDCTSCCTRLVK